MEYKVCKFGGSSVANAGQIRKVSDIVLSDPTRKCIIVSAPGKYNTDDSKVTDMLKNLAGKAISGEKYDLSGIRERYTSIINGLGLHMPRGNIMGELEKRLEAGNKDPLKLMDSVSAYGEEANAKIIAKYLSSTGAHAFYVDLKKLGFHVTAEFSNAQLLPETYSNIRKFLAGQTGIAVIPGYFGFTPDGDIATFSRGGSDYTGSVFAGALGASEYENWTDVDGIFRASPKIVKNPEKIKTLTYVESRELGAMGFDVFHEEAMFPVWDFHVPTHIRNTNKPNLEGTHMVENRIPEEDEIITGVSCKKGFLTLNLYKRRMNKMKGFYAGFGRILDEENIPIEHTPTGTDGLTITFESKYLGKDKPVKRLVNRIRDELEVESVRLKRHDAMVRVVGLGMIHHVGVAARVFSAVANNKINVEMIDQGGSEINITFGVKEDDAENAVRAVYGEFVK